MRSIRCLSVAHLCAAPFLPNSFRSSGVSRNIRAFPDLVLPLAPSLESFSMESPFDCQYNSITLVVNRLVPVSQVAPNSTPPPCGSGHPGSQEGQWPHRRHRIMLQWQHIYVVMATWRRIMSEILEAIFRTRAL